MHPENSYCDVDMCVQSLFWWRMEARKTWRKCNCPPVSLWVCILTPRAPSLLVSCVALALQVWPHTHVMCPLVCCVVSLNHPNRNPYLGIKMIIIIIIMIILRYIIWVFCFEMICFIIGLCRLHEQCTFQSFWWLLLNRMSSKNT